MSSSKQRDRLKIGTFYVKTSQFLRKIKQQTSLLLKNKQRYGLFFWKFLEAKQQNKQRSISRDQLPNHYVAYRS